MEVKISTSAPSLPLHQFLTRLLEDGRMLTAVGEHQQPPQPDDAEAIANAIDAIVQEDSAIRADRLCSETVCLAGPAIRCR